MNDPDGLMLLLLSSLLGIVFIVCCIVYERLRGEFGHARMIERYQAQMRREVSK